MLFSGCATLYLSIHYQNKAGSSKRSSAGLPGGQTQSSLPLHRVTAASPPPNDQNQSNQTGSNLLCLLVSYHEKTKVTGCSLKLKGTLALSLGASVSTLGTRIFKSIETEIIGAKKPSLGMMVNGTTPTSTPWFWIYVFTFYGFNTI